LKAASLPAWLSWYLLLMPLGIPLFTYLVPADLCLVVVLVMCLGSRWQEGIPRLPAPADVRWEAALFVAFLGFSLLGVSVFQNSDSYIFDLVSVLWLFTGAWLIQSELKTDALVATGVSWFNRLFLPVLLFNLAGMATHWLGLDEYTGGVFSFRLYLPFRFPILLGAYLITAYPFAVAWRMLSFRKRMAAGIGFLTVVSGIGARSCMLIAVFQVIWIELVIYGKERSLFPRWLKMSLFVAGVLVAGLMLSGEFTLQRSLGTAGVKDLVNDEPRQRQLECATEHLPEWMTGIGLGCFKVVHGEELHNTPVNLLVETGIGGFATAHVALLLIFLPVIRKIRYGTRVEKHRAGILLCVALSLYLLGLFHNLLRNRFVWLVLALAAGMGDRNGQEEAVRDERSDHAGAAPAI